jgi:tetratricopeptide (TPR) repeat protein/tRNA A-37 threonylcarbamoyl transferase component Bud32
MLLTVRCPQAGCPGTTQIDARSLDQEVACPRCGRRFVPRQSELPGPRTLLEAGPGSTLSLTGDEPTGLTLTSAPPGPAGQTLSLPPGTDPGSLPDTAVDAPLVHEPAGPPTFNGNTPAAGATWSLAPKSDATERLAGSRPASATDPLPGVPTGAPSPGATTDHHPSFSWSTHPPSGPSASATPMVTPPSTGSVLPERIARFKVTQLLGEGAFGRVYRARDEQLDREVAIKVAKAETLNRPGRVERFLREARAAAQLRHPNIVPLFEAGQAGPNYYIASAFIAGQTLETALEPEEARSGDRAPTRAGQPRPGKRPEFRQTAQLIRTLAEALAYAHGEGIVHRDVKPANVMLDEKGQPLLMDFGLASRQDETEKLTHEGAIFGTPLYMAPEQAAGRTSEVGPASDQYSLGVMLYEMLTGLTPFSGPPQVVIFNHQNVEPKPPRKLEPRVPHDLETICLKTLAKKPAERYANCRELADDLRHWLEDEPIQARRASLLERTVKWARRKPTAAALILVLLLVSVGVSVVYSLYASAQANALAARLKVRDEARSRRDRARDYEEQGLWNQAETELQAAKAALEAQPDPEAGELLAEIDQRLAVVQQRLDEQKYQAAARQRRRTFREPNHNECLFHKTAFTGLDPAVNLARTREFAIKALNIYGLGGKEDPKGGVAALLERDRPYLEQADKDRVAADCYELLVIWADTEATSPPGQTETKEQVRQRGEQALALLGRAERLGQFYHLDSQVIHIHKALYLAQSQGKERDLAAAEKAAPPNPVGRLDWFLRGLEKYRQEKFAESIAACDKVVGMQSDDFWAHYVKSLNLLRLGDWVGAKAELTVCQNLRHDFVWPLLLRGFAASELGHHFRSRSLSQGSDPLRAAEAAENEFNAAEADFNKALARDPDKLVQHVGLANRGVLNIRRADVAQLLRSRPADAAQLRKASRARFHEAAQDLQKAVEVYPQGVQGYLNLAQALQGEDRSDDALEALGKAIQLAPELAMLYESRARLYLLRRDFVAAREDLQKAVQCEPPGSKSDRFVNSLVELGRLWQREKNYPEALRCYDRALKARPDFLLTQRFRAETLLTLKEVRKAGDALDEYLKETRNPGAEVYKARGLIYAAADDLPRAVEMYTLALTVNPHDTETRCLRGWANLLNDGVRPALRDFEEALKEVAAADLERLSDAEKDKVQRHHADALAGRANAKIRLRALVSAPEDRQKLLADAVADVEAAAKVGVTSDRLLYNITCAYAQAATQLDAEARTGRDRLTARLQALYEEKAFHFLKLTMESLEPATLERQKSFWKNNVEKDPVLAGIRHGSVYFQMAQRYNRPET